MARQHRFAAEHGAMVRRLTTLYQEAAPEIIAAGRAWYANAEAETVAMAATYGIPRHAIAGIIAALSPQSRWRANLANAEALLERRKLPTMAYGQNVAKAEEIAEGANPADVLGGPKVRAFFANLIGVESAVTVDVWAQRAAYGRDLPWPPHPARYARIARAYQAAAAKVGETPRDLQACIWLSVRPIEEHNRDRETREVFA